MHNSGSKMYTYMGKRMDAFIPGHRSVALDFFTYIHTKLAIMALLPTLYSHIVAVFFIICILKMLVNVKLDVN